MLLVAVEGFVFMKEFVPKTGYSYDNSGTHSNALL